MDAAGSRRRNVRSGVSPERRRAAFATSASRPLSGRTCAALLAAGDRSASRRHQQRRPARGVAATMPRRRPARSWRAQPRHRLGPRRSNRSRPPRTSMRPSPQQPQRHAGHGFAAERMSRSSRNIYPRPKWANEYRVPWRAKNRHQRRSCRATATPPLRSRVWRDHPMSGLMSERRAWRWESSRHAGVAAKAWAQSGRHHLTMTTAAAAPSPWAQAFRADTAYAPGRDYDNPGSTSVASNRNSSASKGWPSPNTT